MKPLENAREIMNRVQAIGAERVLFADELEEWNSFPEDERMRRLESVCSHPLVEFSSVRTLFFRLKWMDVLRLVCPGAGAFVFEVGSGSTDLIPTALTKHDTAGQYVTANMNQGLTQGFREKTKNLPISIRVIEDDAMNILRYLPEQSVDALIFEHSANDIMQAMLAEENGLDTTRRDWYEIFTEMVRLINQEYENETMAKNLKPAFLTLVRNCLAVVKPGGFAVFSHHMYQYDLDHGYNYDLHENIISIIRPWLAEIEGAAEVEAEGFDPHWWLFLKKS